MAKEPTYQRSPELAGDTDADLDLDESQDDANEDQDGADHDEGAGKGKETAADDGNDFDEDDEESVEAQARRLGWVPENEWRGKAGGWVPAKTFLERSYRNRSLYEGSMRKLQKQVDDLEETNKELIRRQEESGQVLKNIWGRFKSADQKAYERGVRDAEAAQRKAVEDGDTEAFDRATERLKNLKPPEEEDNAGGEGNGADDPAAAREKVRRDPVMAQWLEDNPWFDEHYELAQAAQGIHGGLKKKHPNWSLKQNLEEVARQIKQRFPDFFENDADDRRRDSVNTDTRRSRNDREPGAKGRRFSDLPKEAQEACRKMVNTIPGFTTKEYLDTYEWD